MALNTKLDLPFRCIWQVKRNLDHVLTGTLLIAENSQKKSQPCNQTPDTWMNGSGMSMLTHPDRIQAGRNNQMSLGRRYRMPRRKNSWERDSKCHRLNENVKVGCATCSQENYSGIFQGLKPMINSLYRKYYCKGRDLHEWLKTTFR
jgi:hypothetical protein